MSLYNMLNGFNPACIILMPMLNRRPDEYPRFRDCFLSDDQQRIIIYTRVGGGNRNCDFGEEELYKLPNFVKTYDDDFDETYGYYEFLPCDEWKEDFEKCIKGQLSEVSDAYVQHVKEFYPILAENGTIDNLFRPADAMQKFCEENNVDTSFVTEEAVEAVCDTIEKIVNKGDSPDASEN